MAIDRPDIVVRSSLVVGFRQTERLRVSSIAGRSIDRVGASLRTGRGRGGHALPDHVPEEVKEERYQRVGAHFAFRPKARRQGRQDIDVLIDRVDEVALQEEGPDRGHRCAPPPSIITASATGRSKADAPERRSPPAMPAGPQGDIVERY
jgi:ribosomal protein S12 methylthiotransferase